MEPTVDLAINSSTGAHRIELVCDQGRFALEPAQAAKLAADLTTVLSFTMRGALEELSARSEPAKLVAVPDPEPEETAVPRITWHKKLDKQGQTIGYKTDLAGSGTAEVIPDKNKGWNLKINGKEINKAPIGKKSQAYELVNQILQTNAMSV